MKRQHKWFLGAGIAVVVAAIVVQNVRTTRGKTVPVEVEKIARKNLMATVSAPGRIEPKRLVNVSANTIGKIVSLAVNEGDRVKKGDFLLAIDPTPYETGASEAEARVHSAEANLRLNQARQEEAEQEYHRQQELKQRGFGTDRDVTSAETARDVAVAQVQSSEKDVDQARAVLTNARHELTKVRITSEIDGVITRRNVEEGENAITGTMNNPGTVLLTIADLSVLEADVKVDETDVVNVALGQKAKVEIDAFPDTSFQGVVTEVGNSPILQGDAFSEQAADFKVVVTLKDPIPEARPGLSANAVIETARRDSALAVPIQSVTIRTLPSAKGASETAGAASRPADSAAVHGSPLGGEKGSSDEAEGVFVVSGGKAHFHPVKTGIAGETDFEVLRGLAPGDTVVTGDFEALRKLEDGDRVKIRKEPAAKGVKKAASSKKSGMKKTSGEG